MKQPGRIELWLRELACRIVGHDWQKVSLHERGNGVGGVRTGRMCMRCYDAEAKQYRGQYPVPR